MLLGRVVSSVVSTAKWETLPHRQYFWVEPLPAYGNASFIAIDGVQAGLGDLVLVLQEGTGARQVVLQDSSHGASEVKDQSLPAQMVIVGIVDEIQMG